MKKKIYISLFLAIIIFLVASSVLALDVPLPGLNKVSSVPGYVEYIFTFLVGIAGLIAMISFAIGAVGLILAGATASAEGASNAKDRMVNSILGLLLIMASAIILKTINPALLTLKLDPLPSVSPIPISEQSGVYYYLDPGCGGEGSNTHTASDSQIEKIFAGKIKSVKIINKGDGNSYGVIFHQRTSLGAGGCTIAVIGSGCHPVTNPEYTYSADIFLRRILLSQAGSGVGFYSEPFGWDAGMQTIAGKKVVPDDDMPGFAQYLKNNVYEIPADKIEYDWTNAKNADPMEKQLFKTFKDKPGSIQMNGTYLVGLYSKDPQDRNNPNKRYCQTFTKTVTNLEAQPIVAAGGEKVKTVFIIPVE